MPEDLDAEPSRDTANPQADADMKSREEPKVEEFEDLPSANHMLGTLFEESTLWPLVIVLLGSGGAFGAAMMILAVNDRNIFAAAALFLIMGMTIDIVIRARRGDGPRNVAKLLGGFWVSSALLAAVAAYTGIV